MPFRYIDFVITGTPRSGTTYMATLLREIGFDCTHERCFDPWHVVFAEERDDVVPWGDSSWLAAPFLDDLPGGTRVIHVVRDPVDAINSIVGTGQLDWPHDYREFIAHHWRRDRDWWPEDVAAAGEQFWRDWNERIDASGRVAMLVRLESAHRELRQLVHLLDPERTVDPRLLEVAVARVSSRENSRPHYAACGVLTRETVDERTRTAARRYGYDY